MWQATSSPWAHQHTTASELSQHLKLERQIHSTVNITPLVFFFLPPSPNPYVKKLECQKQIAATGVLELWCENEKLTLENTILHHKIKTQP